MDVKLQKHNGAVKINIDGNLYEPLSFKSFRPSARNISDFYKAGVRIFDILTSGIICLLGVPYSLYGESWVGDGKYDFESIDRQIDLFLENAPDAYFALMIQLDTRDWYCKEHGVPNTFTHLSQEIADKAWKDAAKDYLRAVIRHTEQKYGEKFYGYFMLCGMTTEWFSQEDNEETYPTKLEAYREYLGEPEAVIPEKQVREKPRECLLIDPIRDKKLTRYRKFHSELISRTICEFAEIVKRETDFKKLCGVYYGYLFELAGSRLWNSGGLDYERVYTCPYIDMISSPSAYGHRTYDSASAVMVTSDTLDLRDKLYFLEFDHITHLAPQYVPDGNGIGIPGYDSKFKDENQTIDVMRRDFMLCCARRIALWWFDMFEGWFYSDGMMNEIAKFVKIQKKISEYPSESCAEVCVIAEGAPSLCSVNKNSMYNSTVLDRMRDSLGRMGAPYDIYSVCDLENIDYAKYKLFIFLDEFAISDKNREIIESRIKVAGKTLLWFGAPGAVTPDGISEKVSSETVGITLERKAVIKHSAAAYDEKYGAGFEQETFVANDGDAVTLGRFGSGEAALSLKTYNGVKNIFSSIGPLPHKVLTEILKLAGVHIYNADCPIYVNSRIIGLYMNKGQSTVVNVAEDGEYTDMFNGKNYTSVGGKIEIPSGEYRSVMLLKL